MNKLNYVKLSTQLCEVQICFRGLEQCFLTFSAPGTSFMEDNFSTDWVTGMVLGQCKCIIFIVHFVSIITTL